VKGLPPPHPSQARGGTREGAVHKLSHGEGFLALLGRRASPRGLYLLDEPDVALPGARLLGVGEWGLREAEGSNLELTANWRDSWRIPCCSCGTCPDVPVGQAAVRAG
jgi:hypothetical protein